MRNCTILILAVVLVGCGSDISDLRTEQLQLQRQIEKGFASFSTIQPDLLPAIREHERLNRTKKEVIQFYADNAQHGSAENRKDMAVKILIALDMRKAVKDWQARLKVVEDEIAAHGEKP